MKGKIVLERPTKELLGQFSIKSGAYTESSLIESIRALRNYEPLPSEAEKKNAYIKSFVGEWFSQKMRKKYNELSQDIFELKREIKIGKQHFKQKVGRGYSYKDKFKIEIPMFVYAKLNSEKGWEGKFSCDFLDDDDHYTKYEISLFSEMPRIPLNIRQAGREAIGFTYMIYGEALATETLSEVITEQPDYAPQPENTELLVLWKPRPSEIHIEVKRVDNDPALVLNWDKPYLVSTWTEPNEEPFMKFINVCRVPKLDKFLGKKQKK